MLMSILDGLRRDRPGTFFRPWGEILEERTLLSTFTVTQLGDSGAGSLRQAVLNANNEITHPGPDIILFNSGLVAAGPATIALTTVGDSTAGPSALGITSDITIMGPSGDSGVTIARG